MQVFLNTDLGLQDFSKLCFLKVMFIKTEFYLYSCLHLFYPFFTMNCYFIFKIKLKENLPKNIF